MKVRCINNAVLDNDKSGIPLTVGRDYEVTSETPEYYRVTNDIGEVKAGYFRWRFKEVVEI